MYPVYHHDTMYRRRLRMTTSIINKDDDDDEDLAIFTHFKILSLKNLYNVKTMSTRLLLMT